MITLNQINPAVPRTKINLDKERTLVYTNWSYINFEKEMKNYYGEKITLPYFLSQMQNEEDALKNIGMIDLTILIWAGLIIEDPELTIEDVANMLTLVNLNDITQKVMESFGATIPPEEQNQSPLEQNQSPQIIP